MPGLDSTSLFLYYSCIYNKIMTGVDEKKTDELIGRVARECIAGRVRLLNRVVTGIYDRALLCHGITLNQANILIVLSLVREPGPSDVVRMLHMEKSTVSRNIERLRKKGWLEVSKGEDGLSQTLRVTRKGKKLLADTYAGWANAQKEVTELLGKEGAEMIHALTDRIRVSGSKE